MRSDCTEAALCRRGRRRLLAACGQSADEMPTGGSCGPSAREQQNTLSTPRHAHCSLEEQEREIKDPEMNRTYSGSRSPRWQSPLHFRGLTFSPNLRHLHGEATRNKRNAASITIVRGQSRDRVREHHCQKRAEQGPPALRAYEEHAGTWRDHRRQQTNHAENYAYKRPQNAGHHHVAGRRTTRLLDPGGTVAKPTEGYDLTWRSSISRRQDSRLASWIRR